MRSKRPILALTMGDPAGIGPEVVLKALSDCALQADCRPLVIGSAAVLVEAAKSSAVALSFNPIQQIGEAVFGSSSIDIIDLANAEPSRYTVGQISAYCGRAAMEYVARAVELAVAGQVDAMVTAPISKEATTQAGYREQGHLEYIASLTGATEYATMLLVHKLRTIHLTTHCSLREACERVTKDRVLKRLRLTDREFRRWGLAQPRIAAAALNPHAGEGGLYGEEEIQAIRPAIEQAVAEGIDASGPFPADSLFPRAAAGEFDAVLAMYHDQGHIPIKTLNFAESVSVALGLPILRTSVDHGTAFDIAGKGLADARSMIQAIRVATRLASGRLSED